MVTRYFHYRLIRSLAVSKSVDGSTDVLPLVFPRLLAQWGALLAHLYLPVDGHF